MDLKLHFQRFEFKYLMNEMTAKQVMASLLNNHLEWDPYLKSTPDHAYIVTSLYYDSPNLKCYQEKIAGMDKRFKLRQRFYGEKYVDGQPLFYEIKNKKGAVIIKNREVNAPSDTFEYLRQVNQMQPNLLVTYRRQALQGKFQERLRVTFDSDIRVIPATSIADFGEPVDVVPRAVVMEVKYNNTLPGWFDRIITKHELTRVAFSKYCVGIENCPSLLIKAGFY